MGLKPTYESWHGLFSNAFTHSSQSFLLPMAKVASMTSSSPFFFLTILMSFIMLWPHSILSCSSTLDRASDLFPIYYYTQMTKRVLKQRRNPKINYCSNPGPKQEQETIQDQKTRLLPNTVGSYILDVLSLGILFFYASFCFIKFLTLCCQLGRKDSEIFRSLVRDFLQVVGLFTQIRLSFSFGQVSALFYESNLIKMDLFFLKMAPIGSVDDISPIVLSLQCFLYFLGEGDGTDSNLIKSIFRLCLSLDWQSLSLQLNFFMRQVSFTLVEGEAIGRIGTSHGLVLESLRTFFLRQGSQRSIGSQIQNSIKSCLAISSKFMGLIIFIQIGVNFN